MITSPLSLKHATAFIPFTVVGYPNMTTCKKMVEVMIAEGADMIELGVPFSDPVADGPVIQAASEQVSQTTSLQDVLAFAQDILLTHPGFPFVLFTYYNPILKMGVAEFAKQAQSAGIQSVLVVDLPPEESKTYQNILAQHQLKTVFLMSPTTSMERMQLISDASTGFIYYVSRVGVTGTQQAVSGSLAEELARVRTITAKPVAVGFGVSTGEQAAQVAQWADAVVVGSAFVKLHTVDAVQALAHEMRSAIDAVVLN